MGINKLDVGLLAGFVAVFCVALGLDIACTIYVFEVVVQKLGMFIAATVFNCLVLGAAVGIVIKWRSITDKLKKAVLPVVPPV